MKRRKGVVDDYFENIDSDLKAYLLGFFVADGCIMMNDKCVNSYRFSVNISEIDKELIELYQKIICPNNKISITNYKKGAVNRKPTCMIRWISNKMKNDLEKYNIKRNKTYDFDFQFPFDKIDSKFIFSFIRGFFDGDGCISGDKNYITLSFCSTSKDFLKQIGEIFKVEFQVKYNINSWKGRNTVLYYLNFNSNGKKRKFLNEVYIKMYTNCEFSPVRKRNKFENYLNTVLSTNNKKVVPM